MLSTTLNYKERTLLFRRLSGMQHAGIDIIHTLTTLADTGESSGRLPDMLKHSARLETQRLNLLEQQLSEWISRLIYFVIPAVLAFNIAGTGITPAI